MPVKSPATYEEAIERINELEEELESLDAHLPLREREAADSGTGTRHAFEDVARELDADDLLAC